MAITLQVSNNDDDEILWVDSVETNIVGGVQWVTVIVECLQAEMALRLLARPTITIGTEVTEVDFIMTKLRLVPAAGNFNNCDLTLTGLVIGDLKVRTFDDDDINSNSLEGDDNDDDTAGGVAGTS